MRWLDDAAGYGLVHIVLHWLVALAILLMTALGLWMTGLDYYHPWYRQGPDLHRATGVLVGLALLLRLAWRLGSRPPRRPPGPTWERRAATLSHALLYLLPLAMVASGYLLSTADGRPVEVFGWFAMPATLHGVEGQADIAGEVHFLLAMLLLALVAVHAAAALRHHFLLRDDTLLRMLRPTTTRSTEETDHVHDR